MKHVGDFEVAEASYGGIATAGDGGTATAGRDGYVRAGDYGTATAGAFGAAVAGDGGDARAGVNGNASAGRGGAVWISYRDRGRYRIAVGRVGEGGIEADVSYRVAGESGRLVRG